MARKSDAIEGLQHEGALGLRSRLAAADPCPGRFPLHGMAVTGDDPTGALAEENLIVQAGEDGAQSPEPSGNDISDGCGRSLEHGISLTGCFSR